MAIFIISGAQITPLELAVCDRLDCKHRKLYRDTICPAIYKLILKCNLLFPHPILYPGPQGKLLSFNTVEEFLAQQNEIGTNPLIPDLCPKTSVQEI